MMQVQVAGIDTYAIMDSGASINLINQSFVDHHQLELQKLRGKIMIQGVHGKSERDVFRDVPTEMFGQSLALDYVAGDFAGSDVALIIGAPVMDKYVFQFDYPNSRLRLIDHDSIDMINVKNLPMRSRRDYDQPIVQINLNNEVEAWLILDTGASTGIYLQREIAEKHGWLENYPTTKHLSKGVNQIAEVESFPLPLLGFGPFDLADVRVTVPKEGVRADFGKNRSELNSRVRGVKIDGLLGYDVLKHFVLTIDYKNGRGHIHAP
ncbi:aspartyl protease family protein [Pseudidiomarina terrestris]|uniref:Aspartyl protease family protein n=1 Tax=Pseudidiomarina terrestris TaxID=2820060 RepID=A0AAW7QVE2_9GAMM|nr:MULTISPECIES: aspartyl protease family protein [unclassified Pseudidiomarina]MDN7123868.1 aspartyl protease family protein [Pseudidiomarina sp. 1APP75-32.1]MDN7127622.1 aspartyl protease family protein [Pseudidiomarina sp. 1APR75-33.1]MDN7130368.1 aspartyl protease family protein [Pseudidiomarina sp. 1APR75-15]MDN7136291.1 aspartyl protease family protein [Pseudidiomarina sp. 1ASP75-5]MDN7138792.1 aspartyl protease family protein [Pseudidiomarina sp. 1ASP75-14]